MITLLVIRQLSQKRTFTSASTHSPAIKSLSGLTTLDHFQEVDQLDVYTEELKKCGLTEEEIQLKIMADNRQRVKLSQIQIVREKDMINLPHIFMLYSIKKI